MDGHDRSGFKDRTVKAQDAVGLPALDGWDCDQT